MDDFLILLQAKLDEAKSKGNVNSDIDKIQEQLNKLKIQAEIDPRTARKLADDIGKLVNQNIVISNIRINQSNLSRAGQQVGQVISDSAEKAISDVSSKSIGKYFKISSSDSSRFQAEMEKLVSEWTKGKGKVKDINIQTRTSFDEKEQKNIERLHQATVTYSNELDEVIKKTIAWRQIGTKINVKGEEIAIRGFVEVAGQYSKAIDTVSAKTDSFAEKQQKAVASAKNALSSIESKLHDPNITKSLAGTDFNANGLNSQLEKVRSAISVLDNASRDTFTQAKIDVDTEITSLNNLISTLKNAEYAATSLRTKGLETTKDVYASKLDVLVTKMKSSGAYTNGFRSGVDNLKNILNVATDTSGLTAFLNGFDKLEAGYKRAEASAKAFNQAQKVGINVSGLQSKIADLQRISPEIDNFKTNINGADVTVQSLYRDLEKVNTQSDLGVIKEKFKAFSDAAKSAGIAITDVGNITSQSAKESSNLLKSLEKSYQNIKNLQIKKSTLDPFVDSNKLSKLNEEIAKAKNNYNNIFRSANGNFDISAWKEIKSAIDSATKSKIAYNNAGKADFLNEQKSSLTNTLSKLKSSLQENGLYTDELKQKIVALESELVNISNKGDLSTFNANLKSIESDIGILSQINKIQLLSNGGIKNDYATQIAKLEGNFRSLGLTQDQITEKMHNVTSSFDILKTRINQPFNESNYQEIIFLNDKLQTELAESGNEYIRLQSAAKGYVTMQQRLSKANEIEAWNQKNTAATKEVKAANDAYIISLRDLNSQMTRMQFNQIVNGFKKSENSMRVIGKLGLSLKNQMTQAVSSLSTWLSASTLVMSFISKTKEAITELKNVNTLLTEISKTNHSLTTSDLEEIANRGFGIASKYGKTVTDYLTGVQDMSRAGYKNAEAMAEVSTAAQGAGDMTAEVANEMVIATDKAYKLGGSVEELTKILDGVNWICDNNAVNMSELSEGMSIVGSTAASLGVDVNELTAVLGTMAASTQQSGSEVARAFKAILLNIRQVSDEEEEIDAEGLTKYENACNALGVSLKETKDGVLQTRDAMEVLKELSEEYNKLDENDIRRTDLLNSVGGKLRSTQLDAILRQWDTYENMLIQFSEGSGTMALEAEKTANSWEGALNRLHNTWVDTVGNIANSDFVITITNAFNGLLSVINSATSKLGSLGSIGLGAGLFAGVKNIGKPVQVYRFQFICLMF